MVKLHLLPEVDTYVDRKLLAQDESKRLNVA